MAGAVAPWRRLQELADRAEPSMRQAYLRAIDQVKRATSAIRLATAIERGDIRAVDELLTFARLEREVRKAADVIRQLTLDAARLSATQMGAPDTLRTVLQQVNPRAVQVAEQQAARMVTRVSGETRKAIRTVVVRAASGEMTAQQAARQITPLIGLTSAQAKAVDTYRRQLEAAGQTAGAIDAAIERYTQQLLRKRARTIARTETQAAANAGQQAVWREGQRTGLLPDDAKRRWIVTPDDRLCPLCASVGGQTVLLNEPFHTPIGDVVNPPLHPNCRCAIGLDAASLAPARRAVRPAA